MITRSVRRSVVGSGGAGGCASSSSEKRAFHEPMKWRRDAPMKSSTKLSFSLEDNCGRLDCGVARRSAVAKARAAATRVGSISSAASSRRAHHSRGFAPAGADRRRPLGDAASRGAARARARPNRSEICGRRPLPELHPHAQRSPRARCRTPSASKITRSCVVVCRMSCAAATSRTTSSTASGCGRRSSSSLLPRRRPRGRGRRRRRRRPPSPRRSARSAACIASRAARRWPCRWRKRSRRGAPRARRRTDAHRAAARDAAGRDAAAAALRVDDMARSFDANSTDEMIRTT